MGKKTRLQLEKCLKSFCQNGTWHPSTVEGVKLNKRMKNKKTHQLVSIFAVFLVNAAFFCSKPHRIGSSHRGSTRLQQHSPTSTSSAQKRCRSEKTRSLKQMQLLQKVPKRSDVRVPRRTYSTHSHLSAHVLAQNEHQNTMFDAMITFFH